MIKKSFYKELFYVFGSHSNVDNQKFNEQYELFGLTFDLQNFYGDKFHEYIPFKGKIPNGMKLDNIEIEGNVIKTEPIAFLRFLIQLHDFYTNLHHDGKEVYLKDHEKKIVLYVLNRYLQSNLISQASMVDLSKIINDYYEKLTNSNSNILDQEINKIIANIDDHSDLSYDEYIDYKEMHDEESHTLIRDYRNGSRFSLMSKYYLDARSFQDLLNHMNKVFFKGINIHGDRIIEIKRTVKEKFNDEYRLRDYNRGANTITIIYDQSLDEYKKLNYNLNTHEISIHLVSGVRDFKITRIITEEQKELLLAFLVRINNKINQDMRKKQNRRR